MFVSPRHEYKSTCLDAATVRTQTARSAFGPATGSHLHTAHGASTISHLSYTPQPPVSTTHILCAQPPPAREVPFAKPTILSVRIFVQEQVLFLNHGPWSFPWSILGNPNLTGLVTLTQWTAISCIINSVFPFFCGILSPLPVEFHAVVLQEAGDHVPHISDEFRAYTDNTDLAILLNKDTFEPDPSVNTFKADSTSKGSWSVVLLIVRGLPRRPSLTGSPTVTFCSVHIDNVVAKQRDACMTFFTAFMDTCAGLLGGDFNMNAFLKVSDVISGPEFSAPGHSCPRVGLG